MSKEFEEKYRDFRTRLFTRLNGPEFKASGDEVSLYDVVSTLRNKYGVYNNIFFNKLQKDINLINNSNGYTFMTPKGTEKKLRKVGNIGFYANEDGYYFCRVYYVNGEGKLTGYTDVDNTIKLDVSDEELNKNKRIFGRYLSALADFVSKNPEESFRWDTLNPQAEVKSVGDGFISCKIDLYNIDKVKGSLAKLGDIIVSTNHTKEDGVLYDYVEYYNDELLKKSSCNVEDLVPEVKQIVKKELGIGGKVLKK